MLPSTVPFQLESLMVQPTISSLSSIFQVDVGMRSRVLREVNLGSTIPDLLLGVWSGDLPLAQTLNLVSQHILAYLLTEKSVPSRDHLCEELFLSESAALSAISCLRRAGAIETKDSGEMHLQPAYEIFQAIRLFAFEIKLKRWKEALEQATSYKRFADESYVILDGNQIRITDEILSEFKDRGTGLLLQRGPCLEKIIDAVPITPIPSADRVVAARKLAVGPYCLA